MATNPKQPQSHPKQAHPQPLAPGAQAPHPQSTPLPPDTLAPQFTLPASTGNRMISLKDCLGSPVVLVFYPADFTPVCSGELTLYNELLPVFQRFGAQVFGISCDSVWSHVAFASERNLHFPILSDFHPKAEVSRKYHVYREQEGLSERALYVIDGEGKIFWSYVSPMDVNPGADGILDALERLSAQQPQAQQPQKETAHDPAQESRQP